MRIVEEASTVDVPQRTAVVVLEGDSVDELANLEATRAAQQFAISKGLLGAAIQNRGNPYTVGPDGQPLTDPTKGFPRGGKFRIDIKFLSQLV